MLCRLTGRSNRLGESVDLFGHFLVFIQCVPVELVNGFTDAEKLVENLIWQVEPHLKLSLQPTDLEVLLTGVLLAGIQNLKCSRMNPVR